MAQNRSHAVNDQAEEWRAIPSFPGYMASSLGRILGKRGWERVQFVPDDGYPQVNLVRDGKSVTKDVHGLVCAAFHGPRPSPSHVAAHRDGVRSNCRSSNLRWATPAENREDMKAHGTWPRHEQHPRATITLAAAEEIRRRHKVEALTPAGRVPRGWRQRIASEFGITLSSVKDIVGGRVWV